MLLIYLSTLDTDEDKAKMTQIYKRYEGLVYSIAYDYLKKQQDAEDAMHDAFLRIIKNIDGIEEVSGHKTKAFVVIVIESVCKDFLRKKKKIKMTSFELMEYELEAEDDVENSVIENCTAEVLQGKISELESIHMQALVLRYSKQLSYDEMSGILGISNSAVRKRVQRARDILTLKLNESDDIER